MTPHHHQQDRHLPSEEGKGKGKELVVATWPSRRPSLSQSVFTQAQTAQDNFQTSNNTLLAKGKHLTGNDSSNMWTSSSENPDLPSEDGKEDREPFILEYNRLAQRHGIRSLVPEDFPAMTGYANDSLQNRRSSWFSKMLRQVEQSEQAAMKPNKPSMRHQLNPSDTSSFVPSQKQDKLKNQDLKALVRLCGKSPLFLPKDYAPSSLTLPTCLRALAQALVQYVGTEGLFRVPGSARVVDALYDYYCDDGNTDAISNTTRCPTLPSHIRFDAHDLASTFKRFLAGLPGGILGSLSLFDALVAIYSQFQGEAEFYWTKESKLRARLIALAIGTVKSQFQRELICAVFGLLCFVGRAAKTAPREDENGRPLPTSSLMGYNALGVVFGPLLIGNSINDYSMKVADPSAGLILLPIAPQSREEKRKHKSKHESGHRHTKGKDHEPSEVSSFTVDKIHIANSITEMLIVHWREVVRQMRSTGSVKTKRNTSNPQRLGGAPNIASSGSENFSLQNPTYLDHARRRSGSPSTASPTPTLRMVSADGIPTSHQQHSMKAVPHLLSPMIEESPSRLSEAPNTGHGYKRTVTDSSDLSQEAYPISPNRVHGSSPDGSVIRFEATANKLTANDETLLSLFRSSGPQKSENSSLLPSLVRRNMRPHRPRMGRPLPGSGQSVNATTIETNSSTSLEIEKSALLPKLSIECLPRSITNPQICETGPSTPSGSVDLAHTHPRARNKTDGDGEASAKSPVGQWRHFIASGNSSTESLAKSTRERRMRRARGHSSPRPIRQALTIADPNSTTAEEKRPLMRETGKSEERPTIVQPEKKDMSTETPRSTRPAVEPRATWVSPDRHSKDTLRREDSQRSASKPMPGAVKAMAALFNNAAKESPGKPAATPSERARTSQIESSCGPSRTVLDKTLTESTPPRHSLESMRSLVSLGGHVYQDKATGSLIVDKSSSTPKDLSSVQTRPNRAAIEGTPTRSLRDGLRPVKMFSPARKEPQASPSTTAYGIDRSQPPRLGTIVPHQEEPAVGYFVRPNSATPTRSRSASLDWAPQLERPGSRQVSGNSLLHAQIRSLQRQLQGRDEEIAQLRRKLEIQENMDVGTLSEQLRLARRECQTWRKRAEAAERRVAVFQQFGSRVQAQALNDGVNDDHEASSSAPVYEPGWRDDDRSTPRLVRTESQEAVHSRIRRAFAGKMRPGPGDSAVFDDGMDEIRIGTVGEYKLHVDRPRRQVKVWEAHELVDFEHDDGMHV